MSRCSQVGPTDWALHVDHKKYRQIHHFCNHTPYPLRIYQTASFDVVPRQATKPEKTMNRMIHPPCRNACRAATRSNRNLALWLALVALVLLSHVQAAPPDLTAGGVPTTTKNLNLGPTGLHGWLYHVKDDSSESRQILVYSVDVGSPADGILAANDVILGADGTGGSATAFSSDARKALAQALADAEARTPATLSVLRWRAGVTTTETITLQTMGSYAATAPYNCPKSALILEQGIDYVMANQDAGNFSMGTLALLAANNPADPDNAARLARAQAEALAIMPSQAAIDDMLDGWVSKESKITWQLGHKLIVLAEYYLLTGDAQVLPGIEAFAVMAANGQSHLGTMGHQLTSPAADGSLNGAYNVGYGCVNSAGMPTFLGLLLAKQCGLTNPEIDPAIERASRFYASFAGYGAHPYGEHEPYRPKHESNGKSGLAAICFAQQGNRVDAGKFYAQMATGAASERADGHTGPWFNYLWAPLGAAIGGEEAAAEHFSRISWRLDLSRRWDGGFDFNNLSNEGGNGGGPSWQSNFHMYTPALLTYALPLRQIAITGKNPDPARWLTSTEVADATFADDYVATSRTTPELVADLGTWSPKVQKLAAEEIGNRTAEHATLIPQLIAIANDTNAGEQRVGACFALGEIGNGAAAADLADLLDDADDEVRYASAEALRYLPQADKLAQINTILAAAASTGKPFLPIDEEDPMQFAHHRLAMLLFYSGNAYGPKGVIWGSNLTGIDRNLLYPAIRAVAQNPNGQARSCLADTYRNLTQADVEAVSGAIVDSVHHRAPADKMFSGGVRQGGLDALLAYNYAEGVPLSRIVVEEIGQQTGIQTHALGVLESYAGSSKLVEPDPRIEEFCEFLVFTSPTLAADAQLVLDAIAADLNPATPAPFKSIQSVTADASSLTLPTKSTQLHVSATDLADGDGIYTWRKVHGAGQVTFHPNGTSDAVNPTIVFDGTPGLYLFEVTMSDSRGLTEVSDTIMVTLNQIGGGLPPNDPPTATAQSVTLTQATTTPITLTGNDPEGYALSYSVTSQPSNGKLSGTAPYLTYTSDFNFTGSDSFTFEVMDSEGQTASATVSITVDPTSGLETAVYEPFDYPAGLLNGRSGTSEVGLDGVWAAHSTTGLVSDGSLGYGSLFTAGGKFEPTGASNHWGGTRTISSSALASNGLLNDGATLWFSAVVGYGPTANGTNCRLAVALANSGFNTGNYDYWIKDEGAQLGSGVGFVMGRHDGANGRVKAVQFQDLSQGDGLLGNIYGTWEGTGASYPVGGHGLIVGRITWAADPEEPDTIEIFQPNTDMELPTAPISVLNVTVDQSTFDTLTFSRGDYALLDEIRFGSNYHSVLLGTQPLSADVTAPTPDPVGFHVAPYAVNGNTVSMQATTAYDASGVEYYFTCTSGGGNDSGWQDSNTYTDSGLTPGLQYGYTVTARDKSPAQNATAPSTEASVILPSQLAVPNVVGMIQATAESVIHSQSFTVGTVSPQAHPTAPVGEVLSQNPAGDTSAAVGTAVDLVVSSGPGSNSPPVFTADPFSAADATEDASYGGTIAGSATDPDAGDTLAYSLASAQGWLFVAGDGTLSGTPTAGDIGLNSFTVQVDDGNGGSDTATLQITVLAAQTATADFALSESTTSGTVAGSAANTTASDNVYEVLTEVQSGGKPSSRYSLLEHQWTFDVIGNDVVVFYIEAHHTANTEGDDFVFAYSVDGINYTDMLTVTKTADDNTRQSYALPAGLSGTVHVRVIDTDRTAGNQQNDSLYIDEMFILSSPVTDPPGAATAPDPADGATDVALSPTLSWTGDLLATSHDVYFGTSPALGAGDFRGNQAGTSFSPGTLAVNTTYYWAVVEVNSVGSTAGATWSFTTGSGTPQMHVASIQLATQKAGRDHRGVAQVTIVDSASGLPVSGATVSGNFSGAFSESASTVTDASGVATITTSARAPLPFSFTFTVTNVTGPGYEYNAANNVETSDSGSF